MAETTFTNATGIAANGHRQERRDGVRATGFAGDHHRNRRALAGALAAIRPARHAAKLNVLKAIAAV